MAFAHSLIRRANWLADWLSPTEARASLLLLAEPAEPAGARTVRRSLASYPGSNCRFDI